MVLEAPTQSPKFSRLVRDCVDCGFSPDDAARFSSRILHNMPGLSRAEVSLDATTNVAEVGLTGEPADFLFCDSERKSR
jgi:hypothetical protein